MSNSPYHRLYIKEGDKYYLVCRLFQSKDSSLMMKIEPSKKLNGSKVGKIEIKGDEVEIIFKEIKTPAEIDHTSLHSTGASHTKLKDGTYRINYSMKNPGIPLSQLKTIKHLGTLIPRAMDNEDEVIPSGKQDIVIIRETDQKSSIIDLLAVPKNINFKFNADWDMQNDKMVKLSIGFIPVPFREFDLIIFTRSSDQFEKLPAGTLHLADMNNIVPFVVSLNDEKAVIKLSSLTFDELITSSTDNNPYEGFTVITATPKYL